MKKKKNVICVNFSPSAYQWLKTVQSNFNTFENICELNEIPLINGYLTLENITLVMEIFY